MGGFMLLIESFEPYLLYLRQKGLTEKSITEHRRFLYHSVRPSIGSISLKDLRLTDIAKVREGGSKHGKYGAQRAVVTFRQLMRYLKERGETMPFDWRDIEVPKVAGPKVEYLDDDEIDVLLATIDVGSQSGLRTRVLFELLLVTGLRISEACKLDKTDINWEKKEIVVENAKTKEFEPVYLTDRCMYWLRYYVATRTDNLPCLFVSGRSRLLPVTSRNYVRTKLGHLFGKKITHHLMRRTFVTKLVQSNQADIRTVQGLARHKSERTTLRNYTGYDPRRAKQIHGIVMGDSVDQEEGINIYSSYAGKKNEHQERRSSFKVSKPKATTVIPTDRVPSG